MAESNRKHIPHDPWLDGSAVKGTWHRDGAPDNILAVSVACPACGKIAGLEDHKIDVTGEVSPSVVCPREGCIFHDWVTLYGWKSTE